MKEAEIKTTRYNKLKAMCTDYVDTAIELGLPLRYFVGYSTHPHMYGRLPAKLAVRGLLLTVVWNCDTNKDVHIGQVFCDTLLEHEWVDPRVKEILRNKYDPDYLVTSML
jgi:hypothetical protein